MVDFNLDFFFSRFCGFYVLARGYFIFFILSYIFTNKQLPDGAPDEYCRVSSTELKAFIYKVCKEKNDNSPNGSDSYRLVPLVGAFQGLATPRYFATQRYTNLRFAPVHTVTQKG